jgi:hypothetical protein
MITGRCKICLCFRVSRPDMGTGGTFPGSGCGMNLITHLTLMPRLRISEAISPISYMALWQVQEWPHVLFIIIYLCFKRLIVYIINTAIERALHGYYQWCSSVKWPHTLTFGDPCIIVKFIKKNPTRYNNVSNFIISYLYEAQHVSGDTPSIIRSPKLHWQFPVFHMWKVVWMCSWWTLSGTVCATMYQILLFHIYMKLNMFQVTHRPSSGA